MKMGTLRSWWRAVAVSVFCGLLLGMVRPACAISATADSEFAAIKSLVEQSTIRPPGLVEGSEAEFVWRNGLSLKIHEQGLAFIEANPNEPRRWEVVIYLGWNTPRFLKEITKDGRKILDRDRQRQAAWFQRFEDLLGELLSAKDASSWATREALLSLITRHSSNWRSRITTEGGLLMLEKMEAWYARYEREFPRSSGIVRAARALAEVLVLEDSRRCKVFLDRLITNYPSNQYPDPAVREMAEGRLKLLRGLGQPVVLKLNGVGEDAFDSGAYRGKLLLVVVVSVAWRDELSFMRTLHSQFRSAGLEIVQVSGMENRDRTDLPDLLTQAGRAQMAKQVPWRIVWDRQGTIGEFSRSIGTNGFPHWMLVGRDGLLVAEKASQREVMAAIERELEAERRPKGAPTVPNGTLKYRP